MFKELAEIIMGGGLTITLESAGEGNISLTVLPKTVKGESPALSVPLRLTGMPEELDEQLGGLLSRYVSKRKELAESLKNVELVMNAVLEEAQKMAAEKSREVAKKKSGKKEQEKPAVAGGSQEDKEGEGEEEGEGDDRGGSCDEVGGESENSESLFE